jgi:ribose-phosphate pyrophosphokinase
MLETLHHLQQAGLPRATRIAVHGIFAGDAYRQLQACADVISTDCIPHPSNAIEIAEALAAACRDWLHA